MCGTRLALVGLVATPSRPRPPLAARLLALLLGLVIAVVLGEAIATWAMDGAYPTLNLYVADATYGVRLEPNAETRVSSPLGTLTDYRTNADGFRGPDLPAVSRQVSDRPVPGRVLVVGDSQVMGWGVPEDATFPARMAALGNAEVLAVGLPTWGPREYALAVAELVPRLRPERVLVVLNTTNDWVEAPVPNVRRTTAKNGWARNVDVPVEVAAQDTSAVERWLLGRSHLVLALRLAFDPPRPTTLPSRLPLRLFEELARLAAPSPPHRSKLTADLVQARAVALRYGATLVPVIIPMDVEVDPRAWAKYGLPPRDPRPLRALSAGLVADLPETVDLHDALSGRPDASFFLPDDDHLSAEGHLAVARALSRPPSEARP